MTNKPTFTLARSGTPCEGSINPVTVSLLLGPLLTQRSQGTRFFPRPYPEAPRPHVDGLILSCQQRGHQEQDLVGRVRSNLRGGTSRDKVKIKDAIGGVNGSLRPAEMWGAR